MADPVGAYTEALTVTLRDIGKRVLDASRKKHPLYETLKKNFKSQTGTEEMDLPIILGNERRPVTTDSQGTIVPTVSPNIATSAKYTFQTAEFGYVMLNWLDLEKNKGELQIKDRLKMHQEALEYQFQTDFVERLHTKHADLPAGSYLSLDSLTNPDVHTIGGIDNSVSGNENWTPLKVEDTTGDPKRAIREFMQAMTKRTDGVRPDVFLAGDNLWNSILEYLDDRATFTNGVGGQSAELEWKSVYFEGVEIRWDWECDPEMNYALHTPSLFWRYLNDLFMHPLPAQQYSKIVTVSGQPAVGLTQNWVLPVANVFAVGTNNRKNLGQLIFEG